jgi:YegS/Rv2252/BmrU family lipid kinase
VVKSLVILNPAAGGGTAQKEFPKIGTALRDAGVDFDVAPTKAPLHAVEIARDAPRLGYERVIAIGGDGIVHEVVNGLLIASNGGETITLGIIPNGTANDFIKSIPPPCRPGEQRDDWRAAIPRIAAGKTTLVDVGRIIGDEQLPGNPHPRYFDNGVDVGFGAMIADIVKTIPGWLPPTGIYLLAMLKVMANYKLPRIRISLDGEPPIELTTTITMVANGRCFGAAFWLAPEALADDGCFDVMYADAVNRRTILGLLPRLMNGTYMDHPAAHFKQAKRVVIETDEPVIVETDGEMAFRNARRIEIDILPRRLRVNA